MHAKPRPDKQLNIAWLQCCSKQCCYCDPSWVSVLPGPQEEKAEAHEAFLHAFEASRPIAAAIPGLQQFAAGVSIQAAVSSAVGHAAQFSDPIAAAASMHQCCNSLHSLADQDIGDRMFAALHVPQP